MRVILSLVFFLFSNISLAADLDTKILKGEWGGEDVRLWVSSNGADGDFGCSWGRITQPIIVDDFGHFCVTGYVNYYDGNGPAGELPATFIGDITEVNDEDVMALQVNMPGITWHFTLQKGVTGAKKKQCLF